MDWEKERAAFTTPALSTAGNEREFKSKEVIVLD